MPAYVNQVNRSQLAEDWNEWPSEKISIGQHQLQRSFWRLICVVTLKESVINHSIGPVWLGFIKLGPKRAIRPPITSRNLILINQHCAQTTSLDGTTTRWLYWMVENVDLCLPSPASQKNLGWFSQQLDSRFRSVAFGNRWPWIFITYFNQNNTDRATK